MDIFENAFRKIKEATGVSDVNEVIQKIVSQESTTENLIAVTRENQGKIEALNQLRKQIKTHCEELKYSGVGGGQHRKMVRCCLFFLLTFHFSLLLHVLNILSALIDGFLVAVTATHLRFLCQFYFRLIPLRTSCRTAALVWSDPDSNTRDSARLML